MELIQLLVILGCASAAGAALAMCFFTKEDWKDFFPKGKK